MTQFNKVDISRGAPMGRKSFGAIPEESKSVSLFKVKLDSGGYDDGGAYWGLSGAYWGLSGASLYCARSDDGAYQGFTRANSRLEAAIQLKLPNRVLQASPKMQALRFLEKNATDSAALVKRKALLALGYGEG